VTASDGPAQIERDTKLMSFEEIPKISDLLLAVGSSLLTV
jgi:hypothetical protein